MEKCFDSGTLQAFLDGELGKDLSERVACHISDCDDCAQLLAEAEDETAFAFSALEQEFNTLVPTQRLWTKINDSIERNNKSESVWQTAFANFKNLFANPSIAAFAGLLIVAGIFAVVWNRQFTENQINVARIESTSAPKIDLPVRTAETIVQPVEKLSNAPAYVAVKNPLKSNELSGVQVVKAGFERSVGTKEKVSQPVTGNKSLNSSETLPTVAAAEYSPEEDTYIKTIATLEKTVDSRKDEVLKPSARFSFEKDLAVANNAIDTMKTVVKNNPKNEAAKQVLIASYQNKIDLLNSVADQNDLMASLR